MQCVPFSPWDSHCKKLARCFSQVAKPLFVEFTKSTVKWQWGERQVKSFLVPEKRFRDIHCTKISRFWQPVHCHSRWKRCGNWCIFAQRIAARFIIYYKTTACWTGILSVWTIGHRFGHVSIDTQLLGTFIPFPFKPTMPHYIIFQTKRQWIAESGNGCQSSRDITLKFDISRAKVIPHIALIDSRRQGLWYNKNSLHHSNKAYKR